jgi:hypothetical protein
MYNFDLYLKTTMSFVKGWREARLISALSINPSQIPLHNALFPLKSAIFIKL